MDAAQTSTVISVRGSLRRLAHRWRELQERLHGSRVDAALVSFRCNICGAAARAPLARLTREEPTCGCGSTVRQRALVHVLSHQLFGESLAIPDFPMRPDINGIDMSGAAVYADRLSQKLGYTNTFLHKAPRLDITQPEPSRLGRCDFVISSDVFEHVPPPAGRAFAGTLSLLRANGLFVFTVPYAKNGATIERYPELHEFQLERRGRKSILVNRTEDGRRQEFDNLVFHGGEGETLEMRVFSEAGVLEELSRAGFVDVRVHRDAWPPFGIYWPDDWSLPISARRPR